MTLSQLTYFKYVVDEMSLTKAAKKLFVTQSAISQQLSLLAAELDCQLFYRRSRTLHLTQEGEFIYGKAKKIIMQMEELTDELNSRGENVVGRVKIGNGPISSKKFLPDIISSVLKRYPKISFSLFEIHSKNLVQAIIESRINLGLGQIDEEDERIHSEKLIVGRLILICSSQHKWSSLKSVSLRDLRKIKLIHRVREVETSHLFKILEPDTGRNFQLEAMNTETIVPYIKRNMGMALAPDYVIDLMAPEGISKIELEEKICIPWGIFWDKYRPVSKAAQIFIDTLKENLPY